LFKTKTFSFTNSNGLKFISSATQKWLKKANPDGSHKWKYKTKGETPGSPVIGPDGAVYFPGEDNCIYAVNPDGGKKWVRTHVVRRNSEEHPGSGVITDDGTLILGFGNSNRIIGLDIATGQTKW
jgi:outer membrane protein assembly factor BamB